MHCTCIKSSYFGPNRAPRPVGVERGNTRLHIGCRDSPEGFRTPTSVLEESYPTTPTAAGRGRNPGAGRGVWSSTSKNMLVMMPTESCKARQTLHAAVYAEAR